MKMKTHRRRRQHHAHMRRVDWTSSRILSRLLFSRSRRKLFSRWSRLHPATAEWESSFPLMLP